MFRPIVPIGSQSSGVRVGLLIALSKPNEKGVSALTHRQNRANPFPCSAVHSTEWAAGWASCAEPTPFGSALRSASDCGSSSWPWRSSKAGPDRLFELSVIGGHARLLLVIPLFFVCESWVAPRMTAFVATIASNGVVPPACDAGAGCRGGAHQSAGRTPGGLTPCACWRPSRWQVTGSRLQTRTAKPAPDPPRTALAALVYFLVGVTLFRFLLFRWALKLALWSWFLWRVSRLDLRLIPGHPDRAGGLGSLEGVHERFTPLVAALSVLECASLAESISTGTLAVTAVYPWLAMVLLLDGVLFLGPLLVFTDKLWAARTKGLGLYMDLAARYVTEFEAKWTVGPVPDG